MRKFTLFLLLATSAVPVMAQRGGGDDDGDRQSRRASQSDQSDARPQRAQRVERSEGGERAQQRAERQMERQRVQQDGGPAQMREPVQQIQVERAQQVQQGGGYEGRRYQRSERRGDRDGARAGQTEQQVESGGGYMPRQSRQRTIPDTNPQAGQVTTQHDGRYRDGNRDGRYRDGRRYDGRRWSNHWRGDRRYDWRRYRDRNRSIFRIGFYYDPFGYSYRRYGLGSYLFPSYYQSSFWINDPWQYRLPPAYGPYRWVRYHNDALLVDTWSGEVVDVIYGFFW